MIILQKMEMVDHIPRRITFFLLEKCFEFGRLYIKLINITLCLK